MELCLKPVVWREAHLYKKNEVLTHPVTWVNCKNMTLCEKEPVTKATYGMSPFT